MESIYDSVHQSPIGIINQPGNINPDHPFTHIYCNLQFCLTQAPPSSGFYGCYCPPIKISYLPMKFAAGQSGQAFPNMWRPHHKTLTVSLQQPENLPVGVDWGRVATYQAPPTVLIESSRGRSLWESYQHRSTIRSCYSCTTPWRAGSMVTDICVAYFLYSNTRPNWPAMLQSWLEESDTHRVQ